MLSKLCNFFKMCYLKFFLKILFVFNKAKDKYGISALLAAIWEGHTSCVKLMLDKVCTYGIFFYLFK